MVKGGDEAAQNGPVGSLLGRRGVGRKQRAVAQGMGLGRTGYQGADQEARGVYRVRGRDGGQG